jgi:zinc resistance-associated protein
MMRHIVLPLAVLAAWTFVPAAQAASDEPSGPAAERMQEWAADHEAFLDAKLAGLKAGLRLTTDQDELWPPFETAIRDAAKLHMEQMKSMMDRMRKMHEMMMQGSAPGEGGSPIDRLEVLGQRLSERGAAIEKVADAGKPLYASLDDSQKRRFVLLGRELIMLGHGHPGMGMMHGMGMMGHEGMGRDSIRGGESDRMEGMGHGPDEHGPDDEDDNSDEQ